MRYYKSLVACVAILSVSLSAENISDQNVTIIKIKMPEVITPVNVTAKVPKATTNISKVDLQIEKAADATTDIKKESKVDATVSTPTKKLPSVSTPEAIKIVKATTDIKKVPKADILVETPNKKIPSADTVKVIKEEK